MSTVTIKKQTIIVISIITLLLIAGSAITGYTLNNKTPKVEVQKVVEVKPATEVKQVPEPLKVAIAEEAKKKEDVKTILTPEEVKKVETKVAEKAKSEYTNPYFPTLKLPYTSDWSFNTVTNESEFKGLLSRTISFEKNNVGVVVSLYPIGTLDCTGSDEITETKELGNKIKKITSKLSFDKNISGVSYGPLAGNTSCNFGSIVSNINISDNTAYSTSWKKTTGKQTFTDPLGLNTDPTKVVYYYSIRTLNQIPVSDYPISPTNSEISSVDELIKGFQF
jgi:hypothetical protein